MSGEIMGLFVPPKNYDNSTIEEYLEACIANIKLYLEHSKSEHLLTAFAAPQLDKAIEKILIDNNQ